MKMYEGWSTETSSIALARAAIDLHAQHTDIPQMLERVAETAGATAPGVPLRAQHILPFAAEKYNISKDLADYVAVPVIVMPSDLPNRNRVAFPYERLTEFDPLTGSLAFESWRHMPAHMDHINADYSIAKGIVLDVGMRPIKRSKSDLWKVNALLAFDRTRDPKLVNSILSGERSSYSMGALVNGYSCSICGTEVPQKEKPTCACAPDPSQPGVFRTFRVRGRDRLSHWNTGSIKGIEISSVQIPAYLSCTNSDILWK